MKMVILMANDIVDKWNNFVTDLNIRLLKNVIIVYIITKECFQHAKHNKRWNNERKEEKIYKEERKDVFRIRSIIVQLYLTSVYPISY